MTEENDQGPKQIPDTPKALFEHFDARFDKLEAGKVDDKAPKVDDKGAGGAGDDQPDPKHAWWTAKLFGS